MKLAKNEVLVKYIKNKIWIILLAMVVGSGILSAEKLFMSPTIVVQSGNIHVEQLIQINDPEALLDSRIMEEDYGRFLRTYTEVAGFLDATQNSFDYIKFDANWRGMSQEKRLQWIQNHLYVDRFSKGVYNFVFVLRESDAKNIEYSEKQAGRYLDAFVSFSEKQIKMIAPATEFKHLNGIQVYPQITTVKDSTIRVKYAIIGAVIGGLLGVMYIILSFTRKRKYE